MEQEDLLQWPEEAAALRDVNTGLILPPCFFKTPSTFNLPSKLFLLFNSMQ
jgi:hypothetical protein